MQALTIEGIVSEGIQIGLRNMASLVGAILLWMLTFWIPYINIGTTIGLYTLVLAMSRDETFSPTEIFNAKYRKYMGEFFLLYGLIMLGVLMGYLFFIIPGMVISIAWGQALYIMFDKNTTPLESIKLSNEITYGEKWIIFLGLLAVMLVPYIVMLIMGWILGKISFILAGLVYIVGIVILMAIIFGAQAYIYRVLSQRLAE